MEPDPERRAVEPTGEPNAAQKSHGMGMEDASKFSAAALLICPFRIHKSEVCKQAGWENRATLTPPGKVNILEHPVPAWKFSL